MPGVAVSQKTPSPQKSFSPQKTLRRRSSVSTTSQCFAKQPPVIQEAAKAVGSITSGNNKGSGFIINAGEDKFFIITTKHGMDVDSNGKLEKTSITFYDETAQEQETYKLQEASAKENEKCGITCREDSDIQLLVGQGDVSARGYISLTAPEGDDSQNEGAVYFLGFGGKDPSRLQLSISQTRVFELEKYTPRVKKGDLITWNNRLTGGTVISIDEKDGETVFNVASLSSQHRIHEFKVKDGAVQKKKSGEFQSIKGVYLESPHLEGSGASFMGNDTGKGASGGVFLKVSKSGKVYCVGVNSGRYSPNNGQAVALSPQHPYTIFDCSTDLEARTASTDPTNKWFDKENVGKVLVNQDGEEVALFKSASPKKCTLTVINGGAHEVINKGRVGPKVGGISVKNLKLADSKPVEKSKQTPAEKKKFVFGNVRATVHGLGGKRPQLHVYGENVALRHTSNRYIHFMMLAMDRFKEKARPGNFPRVQMNELYKKVEDIVPSQTVFEVMRQTPADSSKLHKEGETSVIFKDPKGKDLSNEYKASLGDHQHAEEQFLNNEHDVKKVKKGVAGKPAVAHLTRPPCGDKGHKCDQKLAKAFRESGLVIPTYRDDGTRAVVTFGEITTTLLPIYETHHLKGSGGIKISGYWDPHTHNPKKEDSWPLCQLIDAVLDEGALGTISVKLE
ncbi:hypothetical protein DID78_06520 [Candidatus Marinamargulisbacteria bacterium SCGC AG-343-D04]|nr:hypothetical protein DID78_06520 [Candidatus Marinamargulisbacteria bacterium SCGC AG-343-D04]